MVQQHFKIVFGLIGYNSSNSTPTSKLFNNDLSGNNITNDNIKFLIDLYILNPNDAVFTISETHHIMVILQYGM